MISADPLLQGFNISTMTTLLDHPLSTGLASSWASEWGEDRFGIFAVLRVGEAAQKLRFIPAGEFQMGSPENEEGRWEGEGPQHWVKLTQGFWLADTPCTQELWLEVMGQNPSRFKGPRLPVEQVRWEGIRAFLKRLEVRAPGSRAALPTEAQWEYACRAGTTASRYGQIGEIAWYLENSGRTTHEVGLKLPNAWGLYDTLGNVWEWCANFGGSYSPEAQKDPAGPEVGSSRVFRGGSWLLGARFVRAAYRSWLMPGNRGVIIGFRLSLGHLPTANARSAVSRSARSAAGLGSGATPSAERSASGRFSGGAFQNFLG